MNERARRALERFRELDRMLAEPEIISSVAKIREIGKERAEIEELATAAAEMERLESMLEGAREVLAGNDSDLREMAEEEIAGLTKRIEAHGERLRILSIPRDPDDFEKRAARQHLRDDFPHICRVIDDQNPCYAVIGH